MVASLLLHVLFLCQSPQQQGQAYSIGPPNQVRMQMPIRVIGSRAYSHRRPLCLRETSVGNSEQRLQTPPRTTAANAVTPAQSVAAETPLPTYRSILVFVMTTILIWLSEPLLSLVDTTVVGRYPPKGATYNAAMIPPQTVELASLGPATLLCDTAVYLTYFLAIATTNQLAIATAKQDYAMQRTTTSHVLGLGFAFGTIILFAIQFFGRPLLAMILGSDGAVVGGLDLTPTVTNTAYLYSKIRGYSAPLTVAGIMAQSVCLATLDTSIPALAVVVTTLLNVVGDIYLVYVQGLGAYGAAIATAMAGAASATLLLASVRTKVQQWATKHKQQTLLHTDHTHPHPEIPFISLPSSTDFIQLAKLCGPIFLVMIGKLVCYSSMTLRSADYGMLELACHSIMLRIFYFFCTFGDSLSQAVQSFLPSLLFGKGTNTGDNNRGMSFLKRMLALGASFAILNSFASQYILRHLGSIFTTDPTILSLLSKPSYVFSVALGLALHPLIMVLEGSIMAESDLGFLMKSYAMSMVIMLLQLNFFTKNLAGVWSSLLVFQVVRFISFAFRVWNRKKRTK